jgi:dihydroneopterin aldolase
MPKKNFAAPRQRISLEGIQLSAYIGVYANEKRSPQPLWVDVELESELLSAARSDRLDGTIDYGAVAQRVIAVAAEHHRNLIETLAFDIATALLTEPHAQVVRVTVHKPGAVPVARDTAVTIELGK